MKINKNWLFLLILPLFWLFIQFASVNRIGSWYTHAVDPEYVYLASGLNLANADIHLDHIDHPGTPLQLFIAATIHVVHFTSGKIPNITDDVLANPEKYLFASYFMLSFLIAFLMLGMAIFVYTTFQNIAYSLFFQLIPFALNISGRLIPDSVLCILFMLIFFYLLQILYNDGYNKRNLLILAILSGASLATKLTFLPFVLIPFLLVRTKKEKIRFLAVFLASFFIIAFPILFQFSRFFGWIKNLFIHTQVYGQGAANVVDFEQFMLNLQYIFTFQLFFTFSFLLLLSMVIYQWILVRRQKLALSFDVIFLRGAFLAIFINILMVAKHFGIQYLYLSFLLMAFCYIPISLYFSKIIQDKTKLKFLNFGIFALFLISFIPSHFDYLKYSKSGTTQDKATLAVLQKLNTQNNLLIISGGNGCVHPALSLFVSNIWSGSNGKHFTSQLCKLYPNIRFWEIANATNVVNIGQKSFSLDTLLTSHTPTYLLLASPDDQTKKSFLQQIETLNSGDTLFVIKSIYKNPIKADEIFEIRATETAFHRPIKIQKLVANEIDTNNNSAKIFCGMENISPDKQSYLTNNSTYKLRYVKQSTEKVRTGKYSAKSNEEYGLDVNFGLLPPETSIDIDAWVYGEVDNFMLVLQTQSSFDFYKVEKQIVETDANGWKHIINHATLPEKALKEEVRFYFFNKDKKPVFIDDLQIFISKKELPENPNAKNISCGMENISPDKQAYLTNFPAYNLRYVPQSQEKVRTGQFAAKLNDEFGLDVDLGRLPPETSINIDAWAYGDVGNFMLVVQTKKTFDFYKVEKKIVETDSKGWKHLVNYMVLPEKALKEELRFFIFNKDKKPVFVDDVKITITEKPILLSQEKSKNKPKYGVILGVLGLILLLSYLLIRNGLWKKILLKIKSNSSIKKGPRSFLSVIFILVICLYSDFNTHLWTKKTMVISWDIVSYYAYLPATFIYKDLSLKFLEKPQTAENFIVWGQKLPNGNRTIKTSMGLAFLYSPFFFAAHLFANLGHFDTGGYSVPYQIALVLSTLAYLLLGLIFLRKILLFYFSDKIAAITLFSIVFGTNLYYYATFLAPMAHAYNFALFAIFLYLTIRWHEAHTLIKSLIIGLLAGLITLIRPTNILILLIFVFWNVKSWSDLKSKIYFYISNYKHLILMILAFILVWIPQLIYWKYLTGQFFYYSYGESEKFFFANPHIISGLFGFRNGWLLYAPIMSFSLLGIFILKKTVPQYFIPILIFTILNIYLILSWWCWWYTGFGNRALIDFYSLLALPFAGFLFWAQNIRHQIYKYAIGVLFAIFFLFGVYHTTLYFYGAIHYHGMTKEAYWESFGRIKPTTKYWKLLKIPDYDKAHQGIDAIEKTK